MTALMFRQDVPPRELRRLTKIESGLPGGEAPAGDRGGPGGHGSGGGVAHRWHGPADGAGLGDPRQPWWSCQTAGPFGRRPATPPGGRPAGDVKGDCADASRPRDRWCLDRTASLPVRERFGVDYDESGSGKLQHRPDLPWQTPRRQHAETGLAAQGDSKRGLRCRPRADVAAIGFGICLNGRIDGRQCGRGPGHRREATCSAGSAADHLRRLGGDVSVAACRFAGTAAAKHDRDILGCVIGLRQMPQPPSADAPAVTENDQPSATVDP